MREDICADIGNTSDVTENPTNEIVLGGVEAHSSTLDKQL